ncbi:MAG: FAD-dependent monooxygenase, partial [Sphingobacteriaceae bacterium]
MNTLPAHNSVIIVGAGPSGLMMAAQLLRFGIQPIIIDSKTALNSESRALAVQARTLEIFRQMGLDETALKEGNIAKGMIFHQDAEEVARFDLSSFGKEKSLFPFILMLEQSKTERILVDYLTANTCPVYWNTTLLDLHQTDKLVNLKINRNNNEEIISCDWLIAADGASSSVRKALKIPFAGGTYEQKFFLADIQINESVSADAVRTFFTENGFTAVFPMRDSNYRLIGLVPKTLRNKEFLSFDDLRPYL